MYESSVTALTPAVQNHDIVPSPYWNRSNDRFTSRTPMATLHASASAEVILYTSVAAIVILYACHVVLCVTSVGGAAHHLAFLGVSAPS